MKISRLAGTDVHVSAICYGGGGFGSGCKELARLVGSVLKFFGINWRPLPENSVMVIGQLIANRFGKGFVPRKSGFQVWSIKP